MHRSGTVNQDPHPIWLSQTQEDESRFMSYVQRSKNKNKVQEKISNQSKCTFQVKEQSHPQHE